MLDILNMVATTLRIKNRCARRPTESKGSCDEKQNPYLFDTTKADKSNQMLSK